MCARIIFKALQITLIYYNLVNINVENKGIIGFIIINVRVVLFMKAFAYNECSY